MNGFLIVLAVVLAIPVLLYLLFGMLFMLGLAIGRARNSHDVLVGASKISGRVIDDASEGMSGVMIWMQYATPGGLFSGGKCHIFGPYITGQDGCFEVPAHPFKIRMTGTMLDGSGHTKPEFFYIHPTRGMYMSSFEKDTPSTFTHRWSQAANIAYSYRSLDLLPPPQRSIARQHIVPGAMA